jgi:hypothetical protein
MTKNWGQEDLKHSFKQWNKFLSGFTSKNFLAAQLIVLWAD